MDTGNPLEVTSIVMLNGSEKTDMLWQADVMSLSNVKQFWKQAKRYGTWRTKAIFFRVLDLAKSIYSIFTLFLPKASQYGYFPVKDEDTEWWSPDWVHCLTEGDYDFEKAAKCLYKNHAPIFFKNENR